MKKNHAYGVFLYKLAFHTDSTETFLTLGVLVNKVHVPWGNIIVQWI